MMGYSPVELDIRQKAAEHAAPPDPRDAWFADVLRVLAVAKAHRKLPLPHAGPDAITFYLTTAYRSPDAPRILADAERTLTDALDVTFTPSALPTSPSWYVLAATLDSGLKVHIHAWALDVAVRHEPVSSEWVRLPVEQEAEDAA